MGAITANLISVRLAYPRQIAHGEGVSARVMAMNPVTGKLLAGVKVHATLLDDTDPKKVKHDARETTTARNGEAILTFDPMGGRTTTRPNGYRNPDWQRKSSRTGRSYRRDRRDGSHQCARRDG